MEGYASVNGSGQKWAFSDESYESDDDNQHSTGATYIGIDKWSTNARHYSALDEEADDDEGMEGGNNQNSIGAASIDKWSVEAHKFMDKWSTNAEQKSYDEGKDGDNSQHSIGAANIDKWSIEVQKFKDKKWSTKTEHVSVIDEEQKSYDKGKDIDNNQHSIYGAAYIDKWSIEAQKFKDKWSTKAEQDSVIDDSVIEDSEPGSIEDDLEMVRRLRQQSIEAESKKSETGSVKKDNSKKREEFDMYGILKVNKRMAVAMFKTYQKLHEAAEAKALREGTPMKIYFPHKEMPWELVDDTITEDDEVYQEMIERVFGPICKNEKFYTEGVTPPNGSSNEDNGEDDIYEEGDDDDNEEDDIYADDDNEEGEYNKEQLSDDSLHESDHSEEATNERNEKAKQTSIQTQPIRPGSTQLPNMLFQASYQKTLDRARGSWLWVTLLTIKDQVLMPFVTGFSWAFLIQGVRTWQIAASRSGNIWGSMYILKKKTKNGPY